MIMYSKNKNDKVLKQNKEAVYTVIILWNCALEATEDSIEYTVMIYASN